MRSTGYVVIELKTGKFQPEYASKLNFYVALVDDVLRRDHHNETIGHERRIFPPEAGGRGDPLLAPLGHHQTGFQRRHKGHVAAP